MTGPDPAAGPEFEPETDHAMGLGRRVALALVLIALTVASAFLGIRAGRIWLDRASKLTFCVSRHGVDQRFAENLAHAAVGHTRLLQIGVKPTADPVDSFAHRDCDLVVARSDAKLPASARALAILEKEIVLLVTHKGREPETSAALRNRKLILASPGADNEALLRAILMSYGLAQTERRPIIPANLAEAENLFNAGANNMIFAVVPRSKLLQGPLLHGLANEKTVAFADIPEAAVLAKRLRGLSEETLEKGLFSASPRLPAEDLTTLSLEVRFVARAALRDSTAAELTRLVFESKADLALPGEFADSIEPPDTDKNAPLLAHPGAAEYVNDEEKSFIDQYGDYFYLGAPVAGAVGSFMIWLFGRWTGSGTREAGDLIDEVLRVAARAREAATVDELDAAEARLDSILHETLHDLRERRLGTQGLDVFRLAYEQTRDWIRTRRHSLGAASRDGTGEH